MTIKDDGAERAAKLRWWAEEIARGKHIPTTEDLEFLSPQETRQTLHELRVHQIELELQNEELRRAQTELDATRAQYFDLYNLSPVGYCILSLDGRILEANLTVVSLLGVARAALVKQPITRYIFREDQDLYYLHRRQFLKTDEPQVCELRMVRTDGTTFWVRLATTTAQDPASGSAAASEETPACRVVLSDITERKQVEAEKAALEAQLKRVQKHPFARLKGKPNEDGTITVRK